MYSLSQVGLSVVLLVASPCIVTKYWNCGMVFSTHSSTTICDQLSMSIHRVCSVEQFSESSDVYSFGVFLLELITGKEAARLISPESGEPLAHWVISTAMQLSKLPRK
jgi:hypothetical protein